MNCLRIPVVVIAILLSVGMRTTNADDLKFGNLLVANGDKVTEYTRTGAFVQQWVVPSPEEDREIVCRDVVVESRTKFHVMTFPGTFMASESLYISTLDLSTGTWTHHTMPGWSLASVTYYGGLGIDRRYIYAPDQGTAGREEYGLVRFDRNDLTQPERFFADNPGDPLWHQVKVGLNGFVYALARGPGFNLKKIAPESMNQVDEYQIYEDSSVVGIAIGRDGHFYTIDLDNKLVHYDDNGNVQETVEDMGHADVEVTWDGTIAVGSGGDTVTLTHKDDLTQKTEIDTSAHSRGGVFDFNFIAWIDDPTCKGATHIGTEGNDVMEINVTGQSRVILSSRGGADRIKIFGNPSLLEILEICTGDGPDTVELLVDFPATIQLGNHADTFTTISSESVTVYGGSGNDNISGATADDFLFGQNGNDTINGKNGNDLVDGGNGEDVLRGGNGDDLLFGGPRDDMIYGDRGKDILDCGSGNDSAFGGIGSDILLGRTGNDTLRGQDDTDYLFGEFGLDTLDGGAGLSFLSGGKSADTLRCSGAAMNTYFGGHGSDNLVWSTDDQGDSRYVPGAGDKLIPFNFWRDDATEITESKFNQLIDPAIQRIRDADVDEPSL